MPKLMIDKNTQLQPGMTWRVNSLGGDRRISDRLAQMGIIPGMELTIVRTGPLGDPLELLVDQGQSIALRRREVKALNCELINLPLAAVTTKGGYYLVHKLQAGKTFKRKMEDRGLQVDTSIEVISTHPFRLRLVPNVTVVTLGRGEAEKVILSPMDNPQHG